MQCTPIDLNAFDPHLGELRELAYGQQALQRLAHFGTGCEELPDAVVVAALASQTADQRLAIGQSRQIRAQLCNIINNECGTIAHALAPNLEGVAELSQGGR